MTTDAERLSDEEWEREYLEERRRRVLIDWDNDYEAPEGYYWDEFGTLQPIPEPDPYSYVIGQDPGGTTGIACLRYTEDTQPELIYLHQIPGGHEGYIGFFDGSEIPDNVTMVSEKWDEHYKPGVDRTPQYIEGAQAALWGKENVVYQSPTVKSLVPDDWLKEQNLWTPGKRHQMDALIHAIVYLRNNDHKPTQKALTGDSDEGTIAEEGEAEDAQLGETPEGEEAKSFQEAMQELAEAAQAAAEAMQEAADAMEGAGEDAKPADGGQPTGQKAQGKPQGVSQGKPTGSGGDNKYHGQKRDTSENGSTKRRERNGVFAGYAPEDGEETVLFSD